MQVGFRVYFLGVNIAALIIWNRVEGFGFRFSVQGLGFRV